MTPSKSFVVSRPRFILALGALSIFLVASSPGLAGEPSGKASVWGASGAGHVDSQTATDPPAAAGTGSSSGTMTAQAAGCYTHAGGSAVTGGFDPDVCLSASATANTSYELDVSACGNAECTWSASGTMNWSGQADVSTFCDADAKTSAKALLVYSGDLKLTGAAAVAASSSESGDKEVSWEISLTPSYTQKYTRSMHASSDTCTGGNHAESNGTGSSVRVNVLAYAQGELSLDTNSFGFGEASGSVRATNRGAVSMSVAVTYDVPDECSGPASGSGPTDGSGSGASGGRTTGGGGGGGVVSPRKRKVFTVKADHCLPPENVGGGVVVTGGLPESPKHVADPESGAGDPTGASHEVPAGAAR